MATDDLNVLAAFAVVAEERSFTRAARRLMVSPSALSHAIRGLEERLGVRLLARTTRSVAPTEAGERLLRTVGPRFEEIDAELAALSALREKPAGTIRITAGEHPADTILWPALAKLLPGYPDLTVEIVIDQGLIDIVAERYDAGVRLGEQVAKDMIAVRIGPDIRMAVVGTPSYFRKRPEPEKPQVEYKRKTPVLAYIATGVGVASLIGAGVFYGMRKSVQSDLDGACPDLRCPPEKQSQIDSGKTYTLLTNVFAVVGIIGVGTGIYLFVSAPKEEVPKDTDKEKSTTSIKLVPGAPGANVGGLALVGAF